MNDGLLLALVLLNDGGSTRFMFSILMLFLQLSEPWEVVRVFLLSEPSTKQFLLASAGNIHNGGPTWCSQLAAVCERLPVFTLGLFSYNNKHIFSLLEIAVVIVRGP